MPHSCSWFFNTHLINCNSRCVIEQMPAPVQKNMESFILLNLHIKSNMAENLKELHPTERSSALI